MAIETPHYKLLKRSSPFELREYSGYVTASVIIKAENYSTATNIGFRMVADYIFGNNKKRIRLL